MKQDRKLGAIILAAGRGKRMNAKGQNKVTFTLAEKPLVKHSVDLLEGLQFHSVVVVVGYAQESVKKVLQNDTHVIFAEQTRRLGTAHAVATGMKKISEDVTDVLVLQGDDSAFYTREVIEQMASTHIGTNAQITFLTVTLDNPFALGRIVRDGDGKVAAIVEEKDATVEQRKIREINAALYFFSAQFLRNYLPQVQKSPVTGEYYLPSLIDLAVRDKLIVETVNSTLPWRGVNTKEELEEAERLFSQLKK